MVVAADRRAAPDPAAAGLGDGKKQVLEMAARRVVADPPRDVHAGPFGHHHQEPAGQGRPAGQLGALARGRRAHHLHQDRIAFGDEIADASAARVAHPRLGETEKACPFVSDLDEGGVDPRHDTPDTSEHDVACAWTIITARDLEAAQDTAFQEGRPRFPRRGADQDLVDGHEPIMMRDSRPRTAFLSTAGTL